jgi:squalene-associated FAD-dependent desaturase
MSSADSDGRPLVAIVGGGLAGLAAAVALAESNCRVDLYEARRSLGGRAGSFRDPSTGETVDHCQHVSMGCCTNLADFCRRVGIEQRFRHDRRLEFIGPDQRAFPLSASGLPAPFHLAPAFWGFKFLSVRERIGIANAMWRLMRLRPQDDANSPTIGAWLKAHHQSRRAIELYWNVILVSALGEELDRASLAAARKVIVDGFLTSRDAYVLEVPQVPLSKLYGDVLESWLAGRGVRVHLNAPVRQVSHDSGPCVVLADGNEVRPDFLVLAVPWHRLASVVEPNLAARLPWLAEISAVESSPITGVHLWFDRPIMPYEHAVLVGRLSQWVFHRSSEASQLVATNRNVEIGGEHYYQVVVSASRNLAGRDRNAIVEEVCQELAAIWPQAAAANRLHARIVTEHAAVFSVRPGLDQLRPPQQTAVPGILVAGDWTATGWPATMEGAVRSGYLAAEGILSKLGQPKKLLADDLPRAWLARLLIRR